MEDKILTKGDVIVNDIEIGDIHYEFEYNICIKTVVISKPEKINDNWCWESKNMKTGMIVNYCVNPDVPSCYAVNLYSYEAYMGCTYI